MLSELLIPSSEAVVFLCDKLRFLSYRIQGENREDDIKKKVALQLYQQTQTLKNLGFADYGNIQIKSWSDVEASIEFQHVLLKTRDLVKNDVIVNNEVLRLSSSLISQFARVEDHSDETQALQSEYLLLETALSIYMNEVVGFDYEVYRRGLGLIDFLYEIRPAEVLRIAGSCNRKLLALELFWGERK